MQTKTTITYVHEQRKDELTARERIALIRLRAANRRLQWERRLLSKIVGVLTELSATRPKMSSKSCR